MDPMSEDRIDALLRLQFEAQVADDGFCSRVMQHLPPRPRRLVWPHVAGLLCGAASAAWALQSSAVLQAGWHDVWAHVPSSPALLLSLATAGLSVLAAAWAWLEPGDAWTLAAAD